MYTLPPRPVQTKPDEALRWTIPFQYAARSRELTRPARTVCCDTPVMSRELAESPSRLVSARRFVEDCACLAHGQTAIPVASLLLSELVASSHATGPIVVRVGCLVTEMKVEATCLSWREGAPDEDDRLRVLLIAKISRCWGVTRDGGARTSWATLPTGALPLR